MVVPTNVLWSHFFSVFLGFGGSTATLILLSAMCTTIRKSEEQEENGEPKDYYSVVVLGLACTLSVFLCIGWLSADCLSAESFPTEVRSTGRGVCVRVVMVLVIFLSRY